MKNSTPKWSILIATVPPRAKKLQRLLDILLPQLSRYKGKVEVVILFNNFEWSSLGKIRQHMLEDARGEYVCFIDDDDLVPKDYCSTIYPLLDGVDYIGFNVELRNEGMSLRPVYHSLKYKYWHEDDAGYYRGVTHLNPIKRELALKGKYPEQDIGEDHYWTIEVENYMRSSGKEYIEHYIDRDMYIYDHFGHEHIFPEANPKINRPIIKNKYVRFHPESTKNA